MSIDSRQIFLHEKTGREELRTVLSNLLISLIIRPDKVCWLVTPWVTDFQLLDNRAGEWNTIQSSWESRYINFSELMIAAVTMGCNLKLITSDSVINTPFIEKLNLGIEDKSRYSLSRIDENVIHTKGLLCSSFFLTGGMNFTYWGTNKRDDLMTLKINPEDLKQAKLEFEAKYNVMD
tara:strand:- start:7279 stop:7812 length:534 start_codon:yes stop_codon:yes gene_type:complete